MTVRFLLAVALAAALLPAGRADAQQADTAAVSASVWTACPGAYVRVALDTGDTLTGRCGPVADGGLQLRAAGGERQVQLTQVDSLWTRRSYLAEATVLLAVAGAAAGALLGGEMETCDGAAPPDPMRGCEVRYGFGRGGSAAIGAVAGAGVGLLVGPRFTRWRLRFP